METLSNTPEEYNKRSQKRRLLLAESQINQAPELLKTLDLNKTPEATKKVASLIIEQNSSSSRLESTTDRTKHGRLARRGEFLRSAILRGETSSSNSSNKKIETLSTPDLLEIARDITIEGQSVKQLYESNKLDRAGLIKMVRAKMLGGNIAKTFDSVVLGREGQLERSHELQHGLGGLKSRSIGNTAGLLGSVVTDQSDDMLNKAGTSENTVQNLDTSSAHDSQPDPESAKSLEAEISVSDQQNAELERSDSEDNSTTTTSNHSEPENSTSPTPKKKPNLVIPIIITLIGCILILLWLTTLF